MRKWRTKKSKKKKAVPKTAQDRGQKKSLFAYPSLGSCGILITISNNGTPVVSCTYEYSYLQFLKNIFGLFVHTITKKTRPLVNRRFLTYCISISDTLDIGICSFRIRSKCWTFSLQMRVYKSSFFLSHLVFISSTFLFPATGHFQILLTLKYFSSRGVFRILIL